MDCKEEHQGSLILSGEPLSEVSEFAYNGSKTYKVSHFDYFVGDI